jgi:hypothetical protein
MPQVLCARCKRDYLDQYDSCPWCGLRRAQRPASTGPVAPAPTPSTTVVAPTAAPQVSTTVSAPIPTPPAPTATAPNVAPQSAPAESLTLGRVLMTIAVIWALIGVANIFDVFFKEYSQGIRSLVFLIVVLFFLFPSLAFFAWGFSRNSRITRATPAIWPTAAGASGTGVVQMPVWQLGWYAMRMPFEQPAIFLRMAIVPLAITIALGAMPAFFHRSVATPLTIVQRAGAGTFVAMAIAFPLRLFIETPFQVSWLRFVVLGDSKARDRGYFRFDEAEKRYFKYAFMLLLIAVPAAVSELWMRQYPTGSAETKGPGLLYLALFTITAIAWVRLAFVLPETATNRFETLQLSWNQTSGLGWRIFAVVSVATLPLMMASTVLLEGQGTLGGFFTKFCLVAAGVFFDFASRAAMLATVAVAYRDWGFQPDKASRERVATVA